MFSVLLLVSVCLASWAEAEFSPLGRGIDLPNYDLMGKLEETGSQVCWFIYFDGDRVDHGVVECVYRA